MSSRRTQTSGGCAKCCSKQNPELDRYQGFNGQYQQNSFDTKGKILPYLLSWKQNKWKGVLTWYNIFGVCEVLMHFKSTVNITHLYIRWSWEV